MESSLINSNLYSGGYMVPMIFLPIISCLFLAASGYFVYEAWIAKSRARDEIAILRGKLKVQRNTSLFLLCIAVGNLLDTNVPFPFPFVGNVSIYFSALTGFVGIILFFLYSRPKVEESLVLAERTGGYLTLMVMMIKLGLSRRMVDKTLKEMLRTGMVIIRNPDKKKLPEIVFLVSNFSGNPKQPQSGSLFKNDGGQIRPQSQHDRGNVNVDDINNMLLSGSMNLGQSGRPQPRSRL